MSGDGSTEIRKFMFTLTPNEVKERHQTAVAEEMAIQSLKSELRELNGAKRGREKARLAASRAAVSREEEREVVCRWRHDGTLGKLIRPDTNEVVETRALTDDERQTEIDGAGPRATNGHNPPGKKKRGRPRKDSHATA